MAVIVENRLVHVFIKGSIGDADAPLRQQGFGRL